jgi:hypothetical protein
MEVDSVKSESMPHLHSPEGSHLIQKMHAEREGGQPLRSH